MRRQREVNSRHGKKARKGPDINIFTRHLRKSVSVCMLRDLEEEGSMDRFTEQSVHDQNFHRYRVLLRCLTDESQRQVNSWAMSADGVSV